MNIAENCFNKLQELSKEVKASHEKLNKLQSAIDKLISDQYHELERKEDFSISEGDAFARTLKETLHKRRLIKDELARLYPIYNLFRDEIANVDDNYRKAVRKSFNKQQAINANICLEQVFEEFGVE
ncbi:hypothetical protein [Cytobacillus oceanisediminis]|uniref:hypothetical protein n=1 Tax=Cytobacillus oceanisediminis TaxID=665099 RepID=UPI0037354EAD